MRTYTGLPRHRLHDQTLAALQELHIGGHDIGRQVDLTRQHGVHAAAGLGDEAVLDLDHAGLVAPEVIEASQLERASDLVRDKAIRPGAYGLEGKLFRRLE